MSNVYADREARTRSFRPGETVYAHGKVGRVHTTDTFNCKVAVEHEPLHAGHGDLFNYDVEAVSRELPATAPDLPQVSDLQDRIERLEATVERVELRLRAIEALHRDYEPDPLAQDDEKKETP